MRSLLEWAAMSLAEEMAALRQRQRPREALDLAGPEVAAEAPDVAAQRALALVELGRWVEALPRLEAATEHEHPRWVRLDLLTKHAALLVGLGRLASAAERSGSAADDGDLALVRVHMGVLLAAGARAEARRWLERARSEHPGDTGLTRLEALLDHPRTPLEEARAAWDETPSAATSEALIARLDALGLSVHADEIASASVTRSGAAPWALSILLARARSDTALRAAEERVRSAAIASLDDDAVLRASELCELLAPAPIRATIAARIALRRGQHAEAAGLLRGVEGTEAELLRAILDATSSDDGPLDELRRLAAHAEAVDDRGEALTALARVLVARGELDAAGRVIDEALAILHPELGPGVRLQVGGAVARGRAHLVRARILAAAGMPREAVDAAYQASSAVRQGHVVEREALAFIAEIKSAS